MNLTNLRVCGTTISVLFSVRMSSSRAALSAREKAYRLFDDAARIKMHEIKDNPGARTAGRLTRKGTNQHGHTQGALERAAKPPLGWIWGDFFRPWHRMFPGERNFNADINERHPLVPLSLLELARLIDLGWIDANRPIDLPALLATRKLKIRDEVGVMLTAEGESIFSYPVHLEVQAASQDTIAAVERAGGTIRVAYYDPLSVKCASSVAQWFASGEPIPVRRAPPLSLMDKFGDAHKRGYLASQAEIEEERRALAAVYGYEYKPEAGRPEKQPTRVFHGLPSGAIVSLADKKVYEPTHPTLQRHYNELRAEAAPLP